MNREMPEHWQTHTGPSNWFRIAFPPTWTLTDVEGSTRLSPPGSQSTVTFDCFWLADADVVELDELLKLDRLFPQRRNVRPLAFGEIPYEVSAFEGESPLPPSARLWKRLFAQPAWQRWRIWGVKQGAICVVATYLQPAGRDPEEETLVSMVLRTLDLADPPADPPDVFARKVVELARQRFPLLKCEAADGFQLKLAESSVNLFNFYRSYINAPDRFVDIVLPALTTVVQVHERGQAQTDPPLDHVRDRILPMLYPESVWQEKFPNFIGEPWVAGLVVLFVVDESNAYWYIRDDLLETWGLTRESLHSLALDNLDTYFDSHDMEFALIGEEHGPRILMPNRPDAYNTSRLLSQRFHGKLQKLLGSEFAVGIPNRDFFVAVNLDSDETLSQIRRKVAEDFVRMDHPLTDRLLLVSTDGVSELVET